MVKSKPPKKFYQLAHDLLPLLRQLGLEGLAYQQYEKLAQLGTRYRQAANQRAVAATFSSIGDKSVIVGPFHSEVGFEMLYWVPFLRWAFKKYGIKPEQVTVVSRGGTQDWYQKLSDNYVDIFSKITPDQLRGYNEDRVKKLGTHKQNRVEPFEQKLLVKLLGEKLVSQSVLIHPQLMYKQYAPFWQYIQPISFVDQRIEFKLYQPKPRSALVKSLPKDYVAVKFYFSAAFPDTPTNRQFVADTIHQLAKTQPVVLLHTGLSVDDHAETSGESLPVISVEGKMKPENNLGIQTEIISHAKAFIGTYGGFSYIAPFYGVPSVSFYSDESSFLPTHLEVAQRAYRKLKHGSFYKSDRQYKPLNTDVRPEFIALNSHNADLLRQIFNSE